MNPHVSESLSAIWVLMPLLGMAVAARVAESATVSAASGGFPALTLPALPYAQEPWIPTYRLAR